MPTTNKDLANILDVSGFCEVGRILHMEHFNHQVAEQDTATVFFMNGMGFTRDPYQRTDETNIGVNVGFQQLHLPLRGPTHPFDGVIGLVVPDLPVSEARLKRLEDGGKFQGTPYRYEAVDNMTAYITSPYGTDFRLHQMGSVAFGKPLGIPYIEFMIPPGMATGIVKFYQKVMDSPARLREIDGVTMAEVVMGPYQHIRFIEKELESYELFSFHIAIFVSHFETTKQRLVDLGVDVHGERHDICFWNPIVEPDTGDHLLNLQHEMRSVYHPDFMHPYTNRWPMDHDPFAHQAEVVEYLHRSLGRT
jgi:hypothetical protein